jgi:hypothetical protein
VVQRKQSYIAPIILRSLSALPVSPPHRSFTDKLQACNTCEAFDYFVASRYRDFRSDGNMYEWKSTLNHAVKLSSSRRRRKRYTLPDHIQKLFSLTEELRTEINDYTMKGRYHDSPTVFMKKYHNVFSILHSYARLYAVYGDVLKSDRHSQQYEALTSNIVMVISSLSSEVKRSPHILNTAFHISR